MLFRETESKIQYYGKKGQKGEIKEKMLMLKEKTLSFEFA